MISVVLHKQEVIDGRVIQFSGTVAVKLAPSADAVAGNGDEGSGSILSPLKDIHACGSRQARVWLLGLTPRSALPPEGRQEGFN